MTIEKIWKTCERLIEFLKPETEDYEFVNAILYYQPEQLTDDELLKFKILKERHLGYGYEERRDN